MWRSSRLRQRLAASAEHDVPEIDSRGLGGDRQLDGGADRREHDDRLAAAPLARKPLRQHSRLPRVAVDGPGDAAATRPGQRGEVAGPRSRDPRKGMQQVEPAGDRPPQLGKREHPLNRRREPEHDACLPQTVGVEPERRRDRDVLDEGERSPDAARPAAAPARVHGEVRRGEGIVEVGLREVEAGATAHGRGPTLQLVEGDVHALLGELAQGAFDPVPRDQRAEIPRLAAGMAQQPRVGAGGTPVHGPLGQIQEPAVPARQAFAHARPRLIHRHRRAEERRHVAPEAAEHPEIVESLAHASRRRYPARRRRTRAGDPSTRWPAAVPPRLLPPDPVQCVSVGTRRGAARCSAGSSRAHHGESTQEGGIHG